ncbi:MAG TPA: hypothetical protein VHO06_21540, partial [Polyangia bacterium]|nr:hypothetical protein [Polyangia bacterium]
MRWTIAGVFGALVALAVGGRARAVTPACSSLPNPVYVMAADTDEPLLKYLGTKLRASTVNPMTLVYVLNGSCTNISAMYTGQKITTNPSYVPSQADDPGWDPTQASLSCAIDPAGVSPDLASSAIFVSSCTTTPMPAPISVALGPISPGVFVVPATGSDQVGITAEEAYFVFGFGDADQVTPWNDTTSMFIRPSTKSTLIMTAAYIDVPPSKWQGTAEAGSAAVVSAIEAPPASAAEKTIGILDTSVYDQIRGMVTALAFRAFQQNYGYFPDSTSQTRDKRNVRDGHYVIWRQNNFLAPTTDANGMYLMGLLSDTAVSPAPDFDPVAAVIAAGDVPTCAMTVTRSTDGGDLSLYAPPAPCGCYYESVVGTPPASCVACSTGA